MRTDEQRPRLDWKPNPDPRSANFRFSGLSCWQSGTHRRTIMRRKTVWLDQGREGACTGFGEEHVRALSPYPQATTDEQAHRVYRRAQVLDEWPGEDYEGSSVNGAMKAAREFGLITNWWWCFNLSEVRHALSYHGAVEFGTWWWRDMWDTDADGFIRPTGEKVGGHAWALSGYNMLNGSRRYRMENSWGPEWGDNGGAWIWEEDLTQLLLDDGEAACPKKVIS